GDPAQRAVDPVADRYRDRRSRLLRLRHVRADAGRAAYWLCDAGGGVRLGDAARFRQPCAGRHPRVRPRHGVRAVAVRAGGRGTGVFDAAMLIALWQFDREDVLAGLLLFRLIYYIIPFALALLILGLRELMLTVRPAAKAGKECAPVAANVVPDQAGEAMDR